MFINCPYCRALVATDPATDLPPTHCPHCANLLRRDASVVDDTTDLEDTPVDLGDLLGERDTDTAVGIANTPVDGVLSDSMLTDTLQAETVTPEAPTDTTDEHDAPAVLAKHQVGLTMSLTAGPPADTETMPAPPHSVPETPDVNITDAAAQAQRPPTKVAVSVAHDRETIERRAGHAPSFVHRTTPARTDSRGRWMPAVAIALTLTLVLQLLLADRARLAGDVAWRPLLTTVCNVFFCDLPPWREPGAFTLLQRDVRQHPTIPGALRVSATFRNDARWPQPWPQLQVTLSDANGRRAGERRFSADDYLGGSPNQAELASGESATIAMDLHEPAARIVAYDFRFR